MSDEGVMLGTHAEIDPRYRESFNRAIRNVCLEYGYSPSNDAVDALKLDMSFISKANSPRDSMDYWHRQWALSKRAGEDAPPFSQRGPTAVMCAIQEIMHPGLDNAFSLGALVDDVQLLRARMDGLEK